MEEKICTKCNESKSINDFSKKRSDTDELRSECKKCSNGRKKEYYRTKKGLIVKIYDTQKTASKLRNYKSPSYSKNQLEQWLLNQDLFHELYNNWVKSNYNIDLIPSIDRPDDYEGYNLGNIQLMTWKENNLKGFSDRKNGINNKQSKGVNQYDLNGVFVKEHHSTRQAERNTGINHAHISKVCKGKMNSIGGFIWKYNNVA